MIALEHSLLLAAIDVNKTLVPVLVALISSGFIFGLVKVLPERRSILVQASENAVKVVNDAIATLQAELTQSRREIAALEADLRSAKENRSVLEEQVDALKYKVAKLEAELEIYSKLASRSYKSGIAESANKLEEGQARGRAKPGR